ncbi:hypothetical protein DPMN_001524 [Dreissena polymorpha]|uniref:Uncharacterized protein n=1 Tax=Dreissena polymorpha TaxID=45954 RepID=A0A9D4RSY2_DREPO|nr:hypothetical protein DPMN_001524 [Dreissena polymorpha]
MTDMLTNKIQDDTEVEFEDLKRKTKIVKSKNTKEVYNHSQLQFRDFLQHVSRVKTQYTAIRTLKAHLPRNEILIHMDFAEKFTCSNADKVQSAYWNSTGVTLHPVDDDKQEATWPLRDDEQDVEFEQFEREIQEPTACSKSKRKFKLEDAD